MKRIVDLAVGTTALVILSPLMVVIAVLVRLTSRGPALFRQERVGRAGRPFTIYKFRSMREGGDDAAQREFNRLELLGQLDDREEYSLPSDPRVTRVGAVLRQTSLDELPQLINVVRGDMSLVGPRPSLAWEVDLFPPQYRRRHDVRPGITGLWQVSGRRTIDMRGMLELDVEYVERQSLGLDLEILARTVPTVLGGRGAG